jgi:hypothetical protein
VSIYEIGHAIFPSGYISIATCARYGALLGINEKKGSKSVKPYSSVDQEERRRALWAITIIDRLDLLSILSLKVYSSKYSFSKSFMETASGPSARIIKRSYITNYSAGM